MGVFVRFFEMMTGTPHKYEESRRVNIVAEELLSDVQRLSENIRPYLDADDPLVALMTDVFNKRQMMRAERAQHIGPQPKE